MTDNSDSTVINMKPFDNLPKEARDDFRKLVLENEYKPSKALYSVMEKYRCEDIDVSTVIRLVEYTYPELDVSRQGFRFNIVDSAYPKNQSQFSDKDFDDGIQELLSLPPEQW